jgi:spore germination cell wall hydrolase CwlJ-like protein
MTPLIFAITGLIVFPDMAAEADVTSVMSSTSSQADNWRNYMVRAAAGSIHSEELVFADANAGEQLTNGRGIVLPNGIRIAFAAAFKALVATPDEDRVTRNLKKGRLVAVERVQPPKDFTAGSILDRRASLLKPTLDEGRQVAFLKPAFKGKEIEIAREFHLPKPIDKDYGVPTELASLVNNDTADGLASAYADPTPDYANVSPFDSILVSPKKHRYIPKISQQDHAWAATALPPIVFTEPEQTCLAQAIYFESATEPLKGQAAVAQVILNRVRNPAFPNTICQVVYQNEDWRNHCQFSFACDRIPDHIWSQSRYQIAREIALAVTAGKIWIPEVGSATHYHAAYVHPSWADTMERVGRIGLHIFYRTYGGGWT